MQHGAAGRQRIGQRGKGGGIAISQQQLGAFLRKGFRQAAPVNPGRAGNDHLLSCKTHGAYPPVARQDAPLRANRQVTGLAP